eukprot:2129694-Pleurochrysis_carterae.AAC.1
MNGALRHTVQLMYVRGTGRRVDAGGGEEVGEAGGQELACVVGMEGSHEATWLGGALIHERRE